MDNNFINIDDLVRQRLSGASEAERPGAWNRMQVLLEEEDRRKPLGIYWNRVMSYCGVAMLMAAVSVGGYEMTTAFRAPAEPATPGTLAGALPASGSSATVAGKAATQAKAGAKTSAASAKTDVTPATATVNGISNTEATGSVAASGASATAIHKVNKVRHHKALNAFAAKKAATPGATFGVNTNDNNNTPNTSVNTTGAEHAVGTTNESKVAVINTATVTNAKHNKPTAADNIAAVTRPVAVKHTSAVVNHVSATPAVEKHRVAAGNVTPASNHIVVPATGEQVVARATKHSRDFAKAPLASGHVTAKVVKAGKLAGIYVAPTVKNNKKVATHFAKAPVTQPRPILAAAKPDIAPVKPIEGKKILERIIMHQTVTNTYGTHPDIRMDTISIDQVTIALKMASEKAAAEKAEAERTAIAAAEEKAAANNKIQNKKGNTPAKPVAAVSKSGHPVAAARTIGSANKAVVTNTPAADEDNLVAANTPADNAANAPAPAAALPAKSELVTITPNAAPPAKVPAVDKPANKKKHGANMAESLSNMFNEVKFKLGNAQFAPGLTAGINGTFFGPNSFRGFQFGFTGAFELDEKWTFMAELKYFHRLNNNYAVNDYFNSYTPVSGGFQRDSMVRSYSFSTLHSFELPLTMRYTAGKCSFFAGGNFVYTVGVNTDGGDSAKPVNIDPSYVSPIVSTNTVSPNPAIHDGDFNARFGVGYIFGLSYKVAPNVTFDLRNVQTVWDNAKDNGSKMISNQLFKSPSFQFSIQYRLGRGGRDRGDQQ